MEKVNAEKEKGSGSSFSGLDISTIEEGLGLFTGGRGDPPGKKDEGVNKSELQMPTFGSGNMIQIPETEEEAKLLNKGEVKEIIKSDEEEEEVIEDVAGQKKQSKKETEDNKSGEGQDAEITEDSPLYLHAATLNEEGILPTLDLKELKGKKFSEGVQAILDAQKKYIDDGRSAYVNSLSERQKVFLEMIENGIPQREAEDQFIHEDAYSKITDQVLSDNEDLQKQVITQDLKLKGFTDKKVQLYIEAAVEKERLFEESKDARNNIVSYLDNKKKDMLDNAKKEQAAEEQKEIELLNTIKTSIESTTEILPGIKLNAAEKSKLLDYMTKPVEEKMVNGQKVPINFINKKRSEDRISFDMRLNYFIQLGLFDKKADLSKFVRKVESSAAEKLARKLKEDIGSPSGKGIKNEREKQDNTKSNIVFPNFKM